MQEIGFWDEVYVGLDFCKSGLAECAHLFL